jgi:repressor LexA
MIVCLTSTQVYGIYKTMVEKKKLTSKQKQVLKFIYDKIRIERLPPTVREIASHFKFSSTGTVRDYLKALVNKGYIKVKSNKSRAIEIVREALFSFPIIGKVQAGLPSMAVEEIEGYLNLDSLVFSDDSTFALRVQGDSMVDDGIMPDDLVLVRKQEVAQTGETVVAMVEDEATVKNLKRRGSNYYLEPANSNYNPIPMDRNVAIIGKVISVVRRF